MKSMEVVRMLQSREGGGSGVDLALNLDELKRLKGFWINSLSIRAAESLSLRSRVASGPEELPGLKILRSVRGTLLALFEGRGW